MPLMKSEESITALLLEKVASARAGDPKDAIAAAMLIHKFPLLAQREGLDSDYEFFVNLGMQSKDPEVLATAGEALIQGKRLAFDPKRGSRYFLKTKKMPRFMGAFMYARSGLLNNTPIYQKMLQIGAEAGHIPSAILLERLRHQAFKKRFVIFTLPSFLLFVMRVKQITDAALEDQENLYMRFWRYKDMNLQVYEKLAKALPIDRAYPFADIEDILSD
jgi:hypothetical protein